MCDFLSSPPPSSKACQKIVPASPVAKAAAANSGPNTPLQILGGGLGKGHNKNLPNRKLRSRSRHVEEVMA